MPSAGEWAVFVRVRGAERGAGNAVGVDGVAAGVKVGKMAWEIKSVR